MPRKTPSACSVPGCPTLAYGRCDEHKRKAEQQRGSAAQRGYSGRAWRAARRAVLRRDVACVLCKTRLATVADHWPDSRRELVERGVPDPDDPSRLRGVCKPCHSRETARLQPGGWNAR